MATLFVFCGVCFLGNISAILMCGAGVIRNLVSLYFACKKNTKSIGKIIASCCIVALLVVLNIYYWSSWLNMLSILIGTLNVVTFMQKRAATIRKLSIICQSVAIIYYILLVSPINIIIEIAGLISIGIGIMRLDRKKKKKIQTK